MVIVISINLMFSQFKIVFFFFFLLFTQASGLRKNCMFAFVTAFECNLIMYFYVKKILNIFSVFFNGFNMIIKN